MGGIAASAYTLLLSSVLLLLKRTILLLFIPYFFLLSLKFSRFVLRITILELSLSACH